MILRWVKGKIWGWALLKYNVWNFQELIQIKMICLPWPISYIGWFLWRLTYKGSLWKAAFWAAVIAHSDIWRLGMLSISLSDVFCAAIQAYLSLEVTKLLKLCSAFDLLSISICGNNNFFQFLKIVLRSFCSMNFGNLQFIFFFFGKTRE